MSLIFCDEPRKGGAMPHGGHMVDEAPRQERALNFVNSGTRGCLACACTHLRQSCGEPHDRTGNRAAVRGKNQSTLDLGALVLEASAQDVASGH